LTNKGKNFLENLVGILRGLRTEGKFFKLKTSVEGKTDLKIPYE